MKRAVEKLFKILFIVIVITALAAPQSVFAQDAVPTDAPAAPTEVVVSTDAPTEAPVVEDKPVAGDHTYVEALFAFKVEEAPGHTEVGVAVAVITNCGGWVTTAV